MFWVHASSLPRFEESYKTIAELLKIPGRHEQQADLFVLVKAWLSQQTNGSWLMVVDNADDESLVLGHGSSVSDSITSLPLYHHLPSGTHGSILFTTRSWSVAHGLVNVNSDKIQLRQMGDRTALQLLQKKFGDEPPECAASELTRLAKLLDNIPLAMTQAVAYIRQRNPRTTVRKYIDELQKGDEERARLQKAAIRDPSRDGESSNSIIMICHDSFKHVQERRPSATRLLSLMAQFDRQEIPEHLLKGQYPPKDQVQGDQQDSFEDDIAILRNFNLINVSTTADVFDMHQTIQFATKLWLDLHDETDWWQRRFIEVLGKHFPSGTYHEWPLCQKYFPYVAAMRVPESAGSEVRKPFAAVLYRASCYAKSRGLYREAEKMARQCCDTRKDLYGPKHGMTLNSMRLLGGILRFRGNHKQAEYILRQTLAAYEETKGQDSLEALECAMDLVYVLSSQRKLEEAEAIQRRVVAEYAQQLGWRNAETLAAASVLADILQDMKRFKEAEALYRRALRVLEKDLGEDHPNTLTVTDSLGLTLQSQKKYDEAEALQRRALTGSEQRLGGDHPDTALSLWCLARLLYKREKYKEALDCHSRALTAMDASLGSDHPRTKRCREHLKRLKRKMRFRKRDVTMEGGRTLEMSRDGRGGRNI